MTAAHEMLHAAYQRLNMFERKHVDEMVMAEYDKIKDQPEIKQIKWLLLSPSQVMKSMSSTQLSGRLSRRSPLNLSSTTDGILKIGQMSYLSTRSKIKTVCLEHKP